MRRASRRFCAQPPVKQMSPSSETRERRFAARCATESSRPRQIEFLSAPLASRPMTSDSAKTVHMLLMGWSSVSSGMLQKSASLQPRWTAMFWRKRPVPAAHLSFMRKSSTLPFSSILMTFESWPPMSSTVVASGARRRAPAAWQVISVTRRSASNMFLP